MNKNVETQVALTKQVFESTQEIVESMDIKDRMQVGDIVSKVAVNLAQNPNNIVALVDFYLHNSDEGYVAKGRFGGFRKGQKPNKTPNPSKP